MIGDRTILPERTSLKVSASLTDFRIIYAEAPIYRLAFRIDIFNASRLSVRLLARKWTMESIHGRLYIVEAEDVFCTRPVLAPRGVFSYGGMHNFPVPPARLELRIAGIDQTLTPFISAPCVFSEKQLTPSPAL